MPSCGTEVPAHSQARLLAVARRSSTWPDPGREVSRVLDSERDRIGQILLDVVVRRMFTTGMHLQSALALLDQDLVLARARVDRAVVELDGAIHDLRTTVFGLQGQAEGQDPRPVGGGGPTLHT